MSEPIKISDDEFAEIKMLQKKFQEMIYKFGNLQIEKMELDRMISEYAAKEKDLKENWSNLQKLEQTLMDKVIKTYGTGNLDMATGTFEPVDEKTE